MPATNNCKRFPNSALAYPSSSARPRLLTPPFLSQSLIRGFSHPPPRPARRHRHHQLTIVQPAFIGLRVFPPCLGRGPPEAGGYAPSLTSTTGDKYHPTNLFSAGAAAWRHPEAQIQSLYRSLTPCHSSRPHLIHCCPAHHPLRHRPYPASLHLRPTRDQGQQHQYYHLQAILGAPQCSPYFLNL